MTKNSLACQNPYTMVINEGYLQFLEILISSPCAGFCFVGKHVLEMQGGEVFTVRVCYYTNTPKQLSNIRLR
jgi:hypothetical protein